MKFDNKKIFVAPYTPRSTMFAKELFQKNSDAEFMGYLDKYRAGEDIYKVDDILEQEFDYILIMSQNHFSAIYDEYKKIIDTKKIIKVDIVNGRYEYFDRKDIFIERMKTYPERLRKLLSKTLLQIADKKLLPRNKIVFINKSFVSTNNKALFTECLRENLSVFMLTDNIKHLEQMKKNNIPCGEMGTIKSLYLLSTAKLIVLDQGNSNTYLQYISKLQKTLQIWHGIPLKRMNRLDEVLYDYYNGPSTFVNETSLCEVIPSKMNFALGYPRNDILVKEELDSKDRLFVNDELLKLSMQNKTILYVPTHREATVSKDKLVPLDFEEFNQFLKQNDIYFIIKFHPFVLQFYGDLLETENYSNIKFADTQSDIYPIMKYCDMLITDYSSIYFDFLVTNKPIVFFNYDYEEYASNMSGLVYSYEEVAPGAKVVNQNELESVIEKIVINNVDEFKHEREIITDKFFDYKDDNSSLRIIQQIIQRV